jgi:DNA-binding winged helix-turn-helix (wHTH) protein
VWRIPAELVTIVSSYGRGGKNYFHLMSWQPDVFHLCFFLTPMQHFATLSSARALTRPSPCCCRRRKWSRLTIYGRDKVVPRQLDESLCGRCPKNEGRFGLPLRRFEIDVARHELRRAGAVVHIEPQVFDLLVYLVQHRDRIVGKDELIEAIWQGRIISEAALSSRICAARRALGDSGNDQSVIRTLHKRGFRFVGEIVENRYEQAAMAGNQRASRQTAVNDAPKLVPNAEPLPLPEPSIAVLPFQNMSRWTGVTRGADVPSSLSGICRTRWNSIPALRWVTPGSIRVSSRRPTGPRTGGSRAGTQISARAILF